MDPNRKEFVVWQWNCRGLGKKRAAFQQHVTATQLKPDVILLQETAGLQASLPGYSDVPAPAPRGREVTTLVRKGLAAVRHDIRGINVDHLLIKIMSQRHRKDHIFILNL
ncbi:hypothetical protein HPB49_005156 [Dermacentor silvarum]|uniref:Uncharacterized protein n=1 Tax=Dermacentor silvarum TaxID=543639 RepID=A0ACB8CPN4_DERSI|nr:hypothetical protein HPB49_005156 [Dermacentor silvarum]